MEYPISATKIKEIPSNIYVHKYKKNFLILNNSFIYFRFKFVGF